MPLLGNKKQRSETACSNEPTAAALTPSINTTLPVSPNVSVNDYIVKQIKSSLEFLVANQGISVYKQSRIGALLDAGLNDEEAALLDKAKFSPKKRNSEETNEQGPVAAWFESTVCPSLPVACRYKSFAYTKIRSWPKRKSAGFDSERTLIRALSDYLI